MTQKLPDRELSTYCFERGKWWFKKNNTCSTEELKRLSNKVVGLDVVRTDIVRKLARKARDAESTVKKCITQQCIVDTNTFRFPQECQF